MPGATDNYVGNAGSGGESYASDSIGSVHWPRVKLTWGVDGAAVDASATNPLPISVMGDPDTVGTGTITAADAVVGAPAGAGALLSGASTAGSVVSLAAPGGDSAWNLQLTGTFGGTTVYYEVSLDSTNGTDGQWINVNGRQTGVTNTVLGYSTTAAGVFRGNTSGVKYFRVRAVGGSAINIAVTIRHSSGTGAIFLNASIPAGSNPIGSIADMRASSLMVTGTAAVNTGVTVTLPAPAAGLFHYITSIQVMKRYSVVGVAAGAGNIITSTNLPGTPAWDTEQLASAAGTVARVIDYNPTTPLKSSVAATATTIVCPAQLQTIWRVNVSYFTAA